MAAHRDRDRRGGTIRRPTVRPLRQLFWVSVALAAVLGGYGLGMVAPQDDAQPSPEKVASSERQSANAEGHPWYETQAPPPAMITAPDAPIFPDLPDEPAAQPLRPYEEALPAEIYEPPAEVKPLPAATLPPATAPPPTTEKPSQKTETAAVTLPPWRRFALAVPEARGRPRIAIVIDDMGIDKERSARVIALPSPLTLSFLTYATELKRQTGAARAAGHELLLHIPMEPKGRNVDPGPNVLLGTLPAEELRRRLDWGFDRFGSYVGVNNHMGSKFTRDRAAMTVVMEEVKRRGLLFLDSRTASGTVGSALARRMGVPFADRNVFLDNQNDPAEVRARLAEVEALARRKGTAIAIGHPREATLEVLGRWLEEARRRGIQFVPLSAVTRGGRASG